MSGGGGDNDDGVTPTTQCDNIIPMINENVLTTTDLAALHPGDTITFAYSPDASATKVRFAVNPSTPPVDSDWHESTTKKTYIDTDFYIWNYTLADTTSFTIKAQWFDGTNWN